MRTPISPASSTTRPICAFWSAGGRTCCGRLGIGQGDLHGAEAFHFVVRRMTIDWLKPARMDDIVTVETRPGEIKGASLVMVQRVLRGDEVLLTADVLVAGVVGRAARPASAFRQAGARALRARRRRLIQANKLLIRLSTPPVTPR